ncbi:MAG: O-antigen ligase family protein [Verrucomicrobiota bacterium]
MEASRSPVSLPDGVDPRGGRSWPAIDRALLERFCERGILGLLLAILVIGPICFGGVGEVPALILQGLTIGIVSLWVARLWLSTSYRLLWAPVCWAVAAFLVYAVARYRMVVAEGGIEYLARQELILVLMYGALFFAILNNLARQEAPQIVSATLLGIGTLLSLYALYQFLTKSGRVLWYPQHPGYLGRGSATYFCPNHLAGLLEMILPLGLAYTLTGRFKPTAKVFVGYAALAVFTGIGVSVSRGAWIGTGLGLLVFFGLLMRHRGQRLAGLIFLALLIGASVFFLKNLAVLQRRIGVSISEEKMDLTRLGLWKPAYQIWQDHFWWGGGPAHFDYLFRLYRPDDIQMRPLYAHNDYLNTLADWGAVGMGLIAVTMVLLFLGVLQSWKFVQRSNDLTTKRSNRSAFVLGAAAGLVALLVHSVVDFNMHIPANAIVAVTLMSFTTGHLRFATERYWFKLGWMGRVLLTGLGVALIVFLSAEGFKRAREYALLRRADRAKTVKAKIDLLTAAHRVEPRNGDTTYDAGEVLRLASWEGGGDYQGLATAAMAWFERGTNLNQFDPYNYARLGMCLDWLDQTNRAGPYFAKAVELDPRNYYLQGLMGWHFFQLGDWLESKRWFEKAIFQAHWHPEMKLKRYETGIIYTNLIQQKLAEKAGRQ